MYKFVCLLYPLFPGLEMNISDSFDVYVTAPTTCSVVAFVPYFL